MRKSTLLSTSLLGLSALLASGAAGCSPYDPDLGNAPYLCAAAEPRCPDDYTCVDDGGGRQVCVSSGGVTPDAGPDGGGFQCAMDGPLEPNDSLAMAYQTDVGAGAPMRQYGPISICPEGDKDHFQINISSPNQGLEVITRWETGMPVANSLLNAAGTSISNGTAMGTNALRACAPNLPVGLYYAVAFSAGGQKNNYRIEMKVVAACN
jgi:hypothetical protein